MTQAKFQKITRQKDECAAKSGVLDKQLTFIAAKKKLQFMLLAVRTCVALYFIDL